MKKIVFIILIMLLLVVALSACSETSPLEDVDYNIETPTSEETVTPNETQTSEPIEQLTPEPIEPKPIETQTAELDISYIPYFGNRDDFIMSAELAQAYVEAIRSAKIVSEYWSWGNFAFDTLYPVLIDISGDGVPLLLLAERDYEIGLGNSHWGILFGFLRGEFQRITEYPVGIGIATIGNERLLALEAWSDFGGWISLYRVHSGETRAVSTTYFFNDFHNNAFYIDDIQVSKSEFWRTIEEMSIEYLLRMDHPGTIHPLPIFEEYLSQSFSREQAIQIFSGYVEKGVIVGDIYYNDIVAISRLFEESFVDVLGEPLDSLEVFFFYDNFQVMGTHWGDLESPNNVLQINAWAPNFNLFEINGISLDMNRSEVLDTFGIPNQAFSDRSLRYRISNSGMIYLLIMRFEDPDDNEELTGITILPP